MTENRGFTLEEQLLCVEVELEVRKDLYAHCVQRGSMMAEVAEYQINCMQAVHDTLSALLGRKGSAPVRWVP